MASPAKKTKATDVPECPYGARCYRKNPQHFIDFYHPKKSKTDASDDATDGPSTPKLPSTDDSSLPPCKYGDKCYRKNLMHFAEYSHPTQVVKSVQSDSGDDTDVMSDEDNPPDKSKKGVKSADILKRGMSLVKSYSKMSEEERKELIKKAFEAKKKLQEELEKTKEEVKKKEQEVEKLNKQVATGLLLMDGEKEVLEGSEVKYFELAPERSYKEGSAAQTHFRLAESQFYRLLSGTASNLRLTKVEYVVNPELVKEFKKCREQLKSTRGEEYSYPVLGFHGTEEKNIVPICETGFKIPGSSGHKHRADTGWYGKGVYFSEYPNYSMGYISGATKFLLCQVLPGKVYNCTKLIHGAALQSGYDSHMSPCKKELVIFNKYHILPSYIVYYQNTTGEFKYKEPSITKPAGGAKTKPDAGKKKLDKLLDMGELNKKYFKAISKKKGTHCFNGYKVQFTGTFQGTQKEMMDLATKHGATQGTKAVFNLLVASETEYDIKTSKVIQATKKGVPIVVEMYLYDCIINAKTYPTKGYQYE
ncbi:uncharacterized protein LOC123532470 [Mercenaria mercenaria]|uniref:uncharacterized protein LOC123532470 n=1 Tax=Mercenaria mercenaria TaxID=6596 RepID=UPI00234F6518|nr:uncharacterized protein LOC123532470 [Mercenaria mercenaria]